MKPRVRNARWTCRLAELRAITIRQPWAWLIVNGHKDIENRSWATRHRGPLLIHAGQSEADLDEAELAGIERKHRIKLPREFERGGVIGVVDVVDCRARTKSSWHIRGCIGWVLSNPRRLPFRPCKGALSLFRPKYATR
jgi:hypothetical protein